LSEQSNSVTPHQVEATNASGASPRNALLAIVAGVALVVVAWRLFVPNAAEAPAGAAASVGPEGRTDAPTATRPSRDEKSTAALRDPNGKGAPASSASAGEEPPAEPLEPTAEDYVRQVQAEPLDAAWAVPAAKSIEEDLRDKGGRLGFTTRQVICRTASCFAEVDFPSQRQARDSFKQMFAAPNRIDCPLRFLYPNDGNDNAPALGILIIDCHDKRGREAAASAAKH
jgi:hypothetical protein